MTIVGLIGAGRMGQVRARVIADFGNCTVGMIADSDRERARTLGAATGAAITTDWRDVADNPALDAVIVATPTKFHHEATCAALASGKHVLCEKPLARNPQEAEAMVASARRHGRVLKTGFNYPFMPHFAKAQALIAAGEIGPVYYMRCHFGHGGRPGYEKEWHTNKELSGGGVLLEQGIHIIDLVRRLLGEPCEVLGEAHRFFWNLPDVEDNFFCYLKTCDGKIADLHVSWTQWVNILHMEIFGRDGYLVLQGRDGHYGPPRLVWAKRNSDHTRPQENRLEFQPGDCWKLEWEEFMRAIGSGKEPVGSAFDGLRAQQVIDAAYASAHLRQWVSVPGTNSSALCTCSIAGERI